MLVLPCWLSGNGPVGTETHTGGKKTLKKNHYSEEKKRNTDEVDADYVPGGFHFERPNGPGQVLGPLCMLTRLTHFNLKTANS